MNSNSVNNKRFLSRLENKKIYKNLFINHNLSSRSYSCPSDYMSQLWDIFEQYKVSFKQKHGNDLNNTFSGQAFEVIVGFLLDRENKQIYSMDEDLEDVPDIRPDFLIKNGSAYTFLSLKTSSRERWKQADWEAIKMKRVYPQTFNVLIMNKSKDVDYVKAKLTRLDLDACIYSQSNEFDHLIAKL